MSPSVTRSCAREGFLARGGIGLTVLLRPVLIRLRRTNGRKSYAGPGSRTPRPAYPTPVPTVVNPPQIRAVTSNVRGFFYGKRRRLGPTACRRGRRGVS